MKAWHRIKNPKWPTYGPSETDEKHGKSPGKPHDVELIVGPKQLESELRTDITYAVLRSFHINGT